MRSPNHLTTLPQRSNLHKFIENLRRKSLGNDRISKLQGVLDWSRISHNSLKSLWTSARIFVKAASTSSSSKQKARSSKKRAKSKPSNEPTPELLMPRNSQLTSTASGSTSIRLPRPAPGGVSYYTPQEAAIDNNADLSWTDKKLNKEAMVEKGMVLCKYTRLNLNQLIKGSSQAQIKGIFWPDVLAIWPKTAKVECTCT